MAVLNTKPNAGVAVEKTDHMNSALLELKLVGDISGQFLLRGANVATAGGRRRLSASSTISGRAIALLT